MASRPSPHWAPPHHDARPRCRLPVRLAL